MPPEDISLSALDDMLHYYRNLHDSLDKEIKEEQQARDELQKKYDRLSSKTYPVQLQDAKDRLVLLGDLHNFLAKGQFKGTPVRSDNGYSIKICDRQFVKTVLILEEADEDEFFDSTADSFCEDLDHAKVTNSSTLFAGAKLRRKAEGLDGMWTYFRIINVVEEESILVLTLDYENTMTHPF